jgi:hypothetical protein
VGLDRRAKTFKSVPQAAVAASRPGRQKTWVYDRLAELQQAALVERAGQGRYRLSRPPTGGWEAVS